MAEDGAAYNGILASRFGLVLIPEVGSQQIEVGRVAELALVVDYQNQVFGEAHHIDGAAVQQLVQFGQLEAGAVAGADGLWAATVRVEQMGLVGDGGFG